ncbi:MAG TPA: tRNA glutamyl-Q(34) synthetase GluQRS [Labilithrix sp.]
MVRTRFAPSPTGDLHVGGAWTALASWALARAEGGATVLRVEDIDTPRVVQGSAERIADDLAWLGLDWDEGPIFQSQRTAAYEDAIGKLTAAGLVYPCDCSRAEIARIASAPHPGEELVYPGTCRDADPEREMKRAPALRLRVAEGTAIAFDDRARGRVEQRVDLVVGDFVLRRGDGVFAYQLVVAVDDADERITDVVRADDLLASTARQILLMRLLGYANVPAYTHVPLVVAPDGERLAKRTRASTIRELRERGLGAGDVIATLARGLGLVADGDVRSARDVAAALRPPSAWRRDAWPLPWI